ncbi:MAG: biotin/lipoyl-binding protein [Planctomycetaceae bacterium]
MFHPRLSQYVLPVLMIAVGAGGFAWLTAKDAPPERIATQPTPPAVETATLQPGVSSFQIRVSGNVVPRREVTLSAEVAGTVIHKGASIESGRHVRRGASLLNIDPAQFQLQVNELGSEIQQVAADLNRLEVEQQGTHALIQLAEREVEIVEATSNRLQALVLKNASSAAESESVERAELQSQNNLRVLLNQRALIPIRRERLQAQLKLTRLEQERAQLNLDRTRIAAPFTGVISTMMVEQGDYVQTGDALLQLWKTRRPSRSFAACRWMTCIGCGIPAGEMTARRITFRNRRRSDRRERQRRDSRTATVFQ